MLIIHCIIMLVNIGPMKCDTCDTAVLIGHLHTIICEFFVVKIIFVFRADKIFLHEK